MLRNLTSYHLAYPNVAALQQLAHSVITPYVLLSFDTSCQLGEYAAERFEQIAGSTGAVMLYSDYYIRKDGVLQPHPTIDYQEGSLRDDFDFGCVWCVQTDALRTALEEIDKSYRFAGLYDLRLRLSRKGKIVRIPEFLYTKAEQDARSSGEKQFDYVDPKNREAQIEMEQACTEHLKAIGAYLPPRFEKIHFDKQSFPVEVSVVIPVRNREKTITEAIQSVLRQKTRFPFNILVVDNHSTDQTAALVQAEATKDQRVVPIVPERQDLGIGGCWTHAIQQPACGKFAIQLDSDDLYIHEHVLQQIVDEFYKQQCAMLVGSYQMVNFRLEEIPPGVIDHREWSDKNGHNNALRINGLGAPRAFYTPVLREIKIPNVSYGEDYATALAICRRYRIGRIYEPLYLCRRWEGNSDAALGVEKVNAHNFYKDRIRTFELWSRIRQNESPTLKTY